MSYRLEFWKGFGNAPASVFDDMPPDEFATREEAESAAKAYCDSYAQKSEHSYAGYNDCHDYYWIRYAVEPKRWRFTRFIITGE